MFMDLLNMFTSRTQNVCHKFLAASLKCIDENEDPF